MGEEKTFREQTEIARHVSGLIRDDYVAALSAIERLPAGMERDPFYAGLAVHLAMGLDEQASEKPDAQATGLVEQLIDYCKEHTRYLK